MRIGFKRGMLSASTLKILACVFMLCDHMGVLLFPQVQLLRIIGRLSYPLFAYFIAEGCRYTKNKLRRFLSVFLLGLVCELVYLIFSKAYYGNILLTFSFSILLIHLLQEVKNSFKESIIKGTLWLITFIFLVCGCYFYCEAFGLDYGFFGVVTPLLALLFDDMGNISTKLYEKIPRDVLSLMMFSVGLLCVTAFENVLQCQVWCLLAIPLLALYNGQRGKYSFKYAFYVFYPLHLILLQGIQFLINSI